MVTIPTIDKETSNILDSTVRRIQFQLKDIYSTYFIGPIKVYDIAIMVLNDILCPELRDINVRCNSSSIQFYWSSERTYVTLTFNDFEVFLIADLMEYHEFNEWNSETATFVSEYIKTILNVRE